MRLIGRPSARAHDGKAYLGISVDGFTFQGGGQRQDQGNYGDQYREKEPSGYGAGGQPGNDPYDRDYIPFQPEWRA